jgi:hypothetical protein
MVVSTEKSVDRSASQDAGRIAETLASGAVSCLPDSSAQVRVPSLSFTRRMRRICIEASRRVKNMGSAGRSSTTSCSYERSGRQGSASTPPGAATNAAARPTAARHGIEISG